MTETTEKTGIEKRLLNLAPRWVEGQSGNPNGRPKKEFSLTEAMREYVSETDSETKRERKDLLIEKMFEMAHKGDISAIKEIWNRLEGMPKGSGTEIIFNLVNIQQAPTIESIQNEETKQAIVELFNREFGGDKERIIAHNYFKDHKEELRGLYHSISTT